MFFGILRYEMAEECADDDDAKEALCRLRRDVLDELKMHNSFVEVRFWRVLFFFIYLFFFKNLISVYLFICDLSM